ncbi:caspase family protein [Rhizobium leguminosarum]|uniref:caspase family protein n=1 Tax=Rhizobium TaxID=379 RepID=UPI00103CEB5B|nr:caspase family protein [Rhizobium leguminosarum]TBZ64206.1 caspase family protein [Rhizobium leguminosarum bv. viciae]
MKFNQGRALVIGVANYQDVSKLPEAVLNDARDIANVLRSPDLCGYPEDNVTVLLDDEATLAGIRKALADLAADAKPDNTVAIFFSGHGARFGIGNSETSALLPYDCKMNDALATTLSEAELSNALAAITASRLLVVMDACHAGGAATLKTGSLQNFVEGFDEKSLQRLSQGTGRVVLASSRASETSLVLRCERNSVFTTALLDGLRGGAPANADGTIRIFTLFNHVSEKVRRAVPGRQHPIFKASDLEDDFPVALSLGGRKSPGSITPASENARDLEQVMADLYPAGPTDQDIWIRAGGDPARLKAGGTGRAAWFAALRTLSQGGGGPNISKRSLIEAALGEFPNHGRLSELVD